ncbi:MAG: DNA internalization-related competence protein ComEC/Rec2 [Thermodesulfobacteriota bacterium]
MAPLAPVFISFAAGIILGEWLPLPFTYLYILLVITFVIPLAAAFMRWKFNFLLISPVFVILGMLFIHPFGDGLDISSRIKREVMDGPGKGRIKTLYDVTGVVLEQPLFTGSYTRLVVRARSIRLGGRQQETGGGVRLTVSGVVQGINKGDMVRFLGSLKAPHNFGNPGEFDYVRWLRSRGVSAQGYVRSPRWLIRVAKGRLGPVAITARARTRINAFISSSGAANPAILKALITGEKRGLSREVRSAYARTGTAHVLAISGLHVGILAYFSYTIIMSLLKLSPFLALRINIKKTALLTSLLPVLGYGLLAGFSRPTERAVIMAVALILAVFMDRGKNYYNTLALAGLIILVLSPGSIFEASFQLSFLAVFFILFLTPIIYAPFKAREEAVAKNKEVYLSGSKIMPRLRAVPVYFRRRVPILMAVTIAASIGTWPVLAYHFNAVSTVGLGANLFVLPITTFIVPTLFLSALLMPLSAILASWGFHIAGVAAGIQLAIVKGFSGLGFASIPLGRPSPVAVFLMYVFIFTIFSIKRASYYKYITIISALVLTVFMVYPHVGSARNPRLKVTFISVGQGDAALIEFPHGKVMLLDGGGFKGKGFGTGRNIIAPLLRYKKIKRIDYMVLSHAQQDHMGGFRYLADNFPVGAFWWNGVGELGLLNGALADNGIAISVLGGDKKTLDIDGVEVLIPHLVSYPGAGSNDSSLVVRLRYGARSFLFPGDMEARGEGYLVKMKHDISADVLKAPHHGSKTSSTMGFLKAVRPELTVISVGRGNYLGFPERESLENYARAGIKVLRTDRDGAVEVSTDGSDLTVKTFGK